MYSFCYLLDDLQCTLLTLQLPDEHFKIKDLKEKLCHSFLLELPEVVTHNTSIKENVVT